MSSSGLIRIRGGIRTDLHVDLLHRIYILILCFVGLRNAFFCSQVRWTYHCVTVTNKYLLTLPFVIPESWSKHFLTAVFVISVHQYNYCTVSFAKIGNIGVFSAQCCSMNYRCTVWLWEAGIVSVAHWSSLDRKICIVSYTDRIASIMQYLYDIFTVLY